MKNLIILVLLVLSVPCLLHAQTTGYFGGDAAASGHPNIGNTTDKWIKIAELTMNGNYYASGITIDFFPKNANHGDAREHLSVQFRNNSGSGLYTTSNDIVLIHHHGQHKIIKDLKAVHTSGTAVSNNKVSVWVQMGISWLSGIPIEVRTYGNVTFETTNQPYHSSITESGTTYDVKTWYSMSDGLFEMNGTIRSKEVKVEASPWPDYVFEPNYDLRSLEEIEQFIQSNKHLPEIPSKEEIEANGLQLGEMNRLLLKKIEELTLYIIELKKENEELNVKIEQSESVELTVYQIEMTKRIEELEKKINKK